MPSATGLQICWAQCKRCLQNPAGRIVLCFIKRSLLLQKSPGSGGFKANQHNPSRNGFLQGYEGLLKDAAGVERVRVNMRICH